MSASLLHNWDVGRPERVRRNLVNYQIHGKGRGLLLELMSLEGGHLCLEGPEANLELWVCWKRFLSRHQVSLLVSSLLGEEELPCLWALRGPQPHPLSFSTASLSVFWDTLENPRGSMDSSLGTTREV